MRRYIVGDMLDLHKLKKKIHLSLYKSRYIVVVKLQFEKRNIRNVNYIQNTWPLDGMWQPYWIDTSNVKTSSWSV